LVRRNHFLKAGRPAKASLAANGEMQRQAAGQDGTPAAMGKMVRVIGLEPILC
jgi:hypothetical protein